MVNELALRAAQVRNAHVLPMAFELDVVASRFIRSRGPGNPNRKRARRATADGARATLTDVATQRLLASVDVPEAVHVLDQRPNGREVLLQGVEHNWLWRPFDAVAPLESVAGDAFRQGQDGSIEVLQTEQASGRIAAERRTLGYYGTALWLLPFAATTPTWLRGFDSKLSGEPCVIERPGRRPLAVAQTAFDLVFIELDSGRQLARFDGGDALICDPRGTFVIQETSSHARVYATDPPVLEATFTALLLPGAGQKDEAAQKALVMVLPDGRFDFVGSRDVALAGLRCAVGTSSVPTAACAERLETPGLLGHWAAKRLGSE